MQQPNKKEDQMTTKPPGWNIEEWEKQMNTTQTQPPQWAMEAAKEWYRMDGDGDRTHEMICGKLAAIISKHAPASNEQKLREAAKDFIEYLEGFFHDEPVFMEGTEADSLLALKQALSTPASPCERCEELVKLLQMAASGIAGNARRAHTLGHSAAAVMSEELSLEISAALAKHKEIV